MNRIFPLTFCSWLKKYIHNKLTSILLFGFHYQQRLKMHMTAQKPLFSYVPQKSLSTQYQSQMPRTILEVEYEIPDDEIYGEGKQVKEITEQIKQQIRQMVKNLPKLGIQERIPYQDVVFKNLEKIFRDRRRTLPGSFIKAQKQHKQSKATKNERHRVSIQIPLENIKNQFEVQEQFYHHSDKNFQYDMRIVIKKVQNKPQTKEHPLKKYLTGRLSQYNL